MLVLMKRFLLPCTGTSCCRVVEFDALSQVNWCRLKTWHQKRRWVRTLPASTRQFHYIQFSLLTRKLQAPKHTAWDWKAACEAYRTK
jgi:hypothetical protein